MRFLVALFRVIRMALSWVHVWTYDRYLDCVYGWRGIEGINQILLRTSQPKHVLTRFGATIGEGTIIYPHIFMHAASKDYRNLIVGENCRILRDSVLDLTERIELCDTAIIGLRVSVITHLNVGQSALKESVYPSVSGAVKIGRGSVTCTNTIILHGVTVGEYSVIGAGSVVLHDVPPREVWAGVPARFIKGISIDTDGVFTPGSVK